MSSMSWSRFNFSLFSFLRSASCSSLSGKGKLSYWLGLYAVEHRPFLVLKAFGLKGHVFWVSSISIWARMRSRFWFSMVFGSVSFFQRSSLDSSLLWGYSLIWGLKVCSSLNFFSASVIIYFVFAMVGTVCSLPSFFKSALTVVFMYSPVFYILFPSTLNPLSS